MHEVRRLLALDRVTRTVVVLAAATQLGAVAVLVAAGASDGAVGDRLRVVPLVAVYGLPPALALLAVRGRPALLLTAAVASLVLALVPFSLHSFAFGPAGLVHLVAYARVAHEPVGPLRMTAGALLAPLLLVGGILALALHDDPVCYARYASGEVTVDRDPGHVTSGGIELGSGVVARGCSSDTVVWWEALSSLALSGGAWWTATVAGRAGTRRDDSGAAPAPS